jgi:hypothetical protein
MIRSASPVLGWLPRYQVGHLVYSDARSIQGTSKFQHNEELEPVMEEKGGQVDPTDGWGKQGVVQQLNEVDTGSHLASESSIESINLRLDVGEEVEAMINESLMPWIFKAMALGARSKCILTPLRW